MATPVHIPETGPRTMVVLSSITFPSEELRKISAICHYEERLLCLLLDLDDPDLSIVYVTSIAIRPEIIDYYLSFTSDERSARSRLRLISVDDPEPSALSAKILARPEILDRMAAAIAGAPSPFIFPFNVTGSETTIADRLGIPLYGPAPENVALGSKSGSRKIARAAGVPVLPGAEDIFSLAALEDAVRGLAGGARDHRSVVVKLNNGFSGQGNAILDLATIGSPVDRSPTVFCADEERWSTYARKIEAEGAIVELMIRDPGAASPSVQLRIGGDGAVETISTHDQILGGPDGQVYLGCRFPAREWYRLEIQEHARRVGEVLASAGVVGVFGIDFVVVPRDGRCDTYLSEINLRVGGTTHPFLMAAGVTAGTYDPNSGELLAGGRPIRYVAGDNIKSERYSSLMPAHVIDELRRSGLAYDRRSRRGVTLHLLGALPGFGKMGAVCIADTYEEADGLFARLEGLLESLAG